MRFFLSLTPVSKFGQGLRTNAPLEGADAGTPYCDVYPLAWPLVKGAHVGGFRLGSSIALVFEAPEHAEFVVRPGQKLAMGQPLVTITAK